MSSANQPSTATLFDVHSRSYMLFTRDGYRNFDPIRLSYRKIEPIYDNYRDNYNNRGFQRNTLNVWFHQYNCATIDFNL